MIKIMFPTSFRYLRSGGVSNYIKILVENIDKNQFSIFDMDGETNLGNIEFLSHDKKIGIFRFFLNIYYILVFKKKIIQYEPDVVHLNPSLVWGSIIRDFIFLKLIKKRKIPVLFFIHGWQNEISRRFSSFVFRSYFKKRFEMADAIIVLANKFKKELVNLGVSSEKIYISSTMVESEKYRPGNKKLSRPYTILFCATMKKEKGPFTLLNAASKVLNEFPHTKFLFIGSGKDLPVLKEKSIKVGLQENVEFTGYISEEKKQKFFKNSHIFVFPTEHGEGFPTVILEAMAAGMPLITTADAGLKDALENNKQGLIINSKPPKHEEISNKIIKLLTDKENMIKISNNNILEVKEKYDVKIVCKEIEKLYNIILNN